MSSPQGLPKIIPLSSTNRRSFSIKRENIFDGQRGEAVGSAIAVQKLDLDPIRREQLYDSTNITDFDVSVRWTLQDRNKV
jgi:hypothetical protein